MKKHTNPQPPTNQSGSSKKSVNELDKNLWNKPLLARF